MQRADGTVIEGTRAVLRTRTDANKGQIRGNDTYRAMHFAVVSVAEYTRYSVPLGTTLNIPHCGSA